MTDRNPEAKKWHSYNATFSTFTISISSARLGGRNVSINAKFMDGENSQAPGAMGESIQAKTLDEMDDL